MAFDYVTERPVSVADKKYDATKITKGTKTESVLVVFVILVCPDTRAAPC